MKWIDVKQELPPVGARVLLWCIKTMRGEDPYYVLGRMEERGLRMDGGSVCTEWFTHWAHIDPPPAPPEGESDEPRKP